MRTRTLFALFLLCAFTLYPTSTTAQPVVDSDGEVVKNGGSYYLLPIIWALGGGLGLAQTGNETCPLTVVQYPFEVSNGLPVTLSSMFRSLFLPEGRVDLSFTAVPACASTPSKWTVVNDLSQGLVVKLSGYYDNTVDGFFTIEKSSSFPSPSYKFSFCNIHGEECKKIGIVKDDKNNRLLGVTEKNEFQFVLVKATTSSSSSSS